MLIQTLDLQNPSFYPDTFRVMRSTTLLSEHGIDFIIRSAANHSNYEWVLVKGYRVAHARHCGSSHITKLFPSFVFSTIYGSVKTPQQQHGSFRI